jgi:hypothetical protein
MEGRYLIWEKHMINEVFLALKGMGECRSASAFSREYLGMESNYFRGLKWRDRQPSPRALAHCASALREKGELLSHCEKPFIVERREKLLGLADSCIESLLCSAVCD